jgi:D-tyrosyl-tRNA(Tyr) deacylase
MIALLQRVTHGSVSVDDAIIGEIKTGLVVLIGIQRGDTIESAEKLLNKVIGYRVFSDENDKMNLSLSDVSGGLLLVPQFTLAASTEKGLRPSFTPAEAPEKSRQLFTELVALAQTRHHDVKQGQFGADMQVALTNDGPVTFWLEVKPPQQ